MLVPEPVSANDRFPQRAKKLAARHAFDTTQQRRSVVAVFCAVVCWRCVLRFRFRTDAGLSSTLNDTKEPSWCSGRSACAPSLLTSYLHRSYIMMFYTCLSYMSVCVSELLMQSESMSSLLLRNELRSFALLIWYAAAVCLPLFSVCYLVERQASGPFWSVCTPR